MRPIVSENLAPPQWVLRLLPDGGDKPEVHRSGSDVDLVIQRHRSTDAVLVSATVPNATSLSCADFRSVAGDAYSAIFALVPKGHHPSRFWNYIPDIHAAMDGGLDRYMVFNLGRRGALSDRYGSVNAIGLSVPTATGVGHVGTSLVIHCLALPGNPQQVENPRQVSAYQYSELYGPASPSFSRATLVGLPGVSGQSLLVGGTSSVRGEDTIAPNDIHAQLDETCENLNALVKRAFGDAADLECFDSVRTYLAPGCEEHPIINTLQQTFPNATDIELVQADICRRPLLIEIEGVAQQPQNSL